MATVYKNKQLMYLSAILFLYFASIGCLSPFLTSHMRHLGFSLSKISFINAISALFSLIGPILGGTFAERRNQYKFTSTFCILVGALAFVALSFVPRYDKLNYGPLVDFDCDAGVRVERCVNWATCGEALEPNINLTKVRLSDCHYQCPKSGHIPPTYPLHICFHGESNICVVFDAVDSNNSMTEFETMLHSWPYVEVPASYNITMASSNELYEEDIPRAHVAMCNYLPSGPIQFGPKNYQSITCRPSREDCTIHCKVAMSAGGVEIWPRPCEEAFGNPTATFWTYLILRCVGDLCLLTTICLLDAVTIWSTIDYEGAYGRIHVWAALGMAASSPLSGTLLDYYTDMDGRADFSPSSFLAAALAVITCALLIAIPIQRQKSTQLSYGMPRGSSLTLSKETRFFTAEMIIFLSVVLIFGIQWSILFTFLPWLTTDIGCSALTTGIATTLMFGFSIPFLLISKNMVRNIGRANLLVFAFLFYFTRYAGVTFVSSPWWILPFALMGTFTLCVMWIASVAYGQALAPPGYSLIMQYLLNMLHFALGRGIGSLVGGALISSYSQRMVFCGIAVFSAILGFSFLITYHLALKKRTKRSYPAILNGSWYPLRERYPNGDAKAHQPIVVDQDDGIDSPPMSRQAGYNKE